MLKAYDKLLPLVTVLLLQPMYFMLVSISKLNASSYPTGALVDSPWSITVMSLILTMAVLYCVKKITATLETEVETRVRLEGLENIEELIHTVRSQRHDFNNQLQIVMGLLDNGSFEAARDYLKEAYRPVLTTNQILTDNHAITALLQVKANRAETQGIPTEFTVRGSIKQPALPTHELNTILGNLLDNAIEAAANLPPAERSITVDITSSADGLSIAVTNSGAIPKEVKEKMLRPGFTTKRTGQGMGMYSVQQLVNKYSGKLSINTPGNFTHIMVEFTYKKLVSGG